MSHRRDVCGVGIFWIDNDARDATTVSESNIRPMVAAVRGPINSIAPVGRVSVVGFTGADPDHVRIRWRNRDRADRENGLLIENWIEGDAAIAGLENAAMTKRDIKRKRIARINSNVGDATAHNGRSNRARFE